MTQFLDSLCWAVFVLCEASVVAQETPVPLTTCYAQFENGEWVDMTDPPCTQVSSSSQDYQQLECRTDLIKETSTSIIYTNTYHNDSSCSILTSSIATSNIKSYQCQCADYQNRDPPAPFLPNLDTGNPTQSPTVKPTPSPSEQPTLRPSIQPSIFPTNQPTESPSSDPTTSPSKIPSVSPTNNPTTPAPTDNPTTHRPTMSGETREPTGDPTQSPSIGPTASPSCNPSVSPTTTEPSTSPTMTSNYPSVSPTTYPTILPREDATVSVTDNVDDDDDQGEDNDNDSAQEETSNNGPSSKLFTLPAVIVGSLCILLTMSLFVVAMYRFFGPKAKNRDACPAIFTFIANLIGMSCLMTVCVLIQTTVQWDTQRYEMTVIPYYSLIAAYAFSKLCLQTFFIVRVRNTFQNTPYAMSMGTIFVLIVCMICLSLLWCYMLSTSGTLPVYSYMLLPIIEAVFCLCLLFLFTRRLHKVLELSKMHQNETDYGQTASSSKQRKLLFLITRCVILSAFAMTTTLAFGGYAFYYLHAEPEDVDVYILYGLWFLDMTINSVCLYMNFSFADNMYKRSCGCCHKGCQVMMEWCFAKRLSKKKRPGVQLAAYVETEQPAVTQPDDI